MRFHVSIESRRIRLLDTDNLVGGSKFVLDLLKKRGGCGLIDDDAPDRIALSVTQTKVRHPVDECTVITVTPLP